MTEMDAVFQKTRELGQALMESEAYQKMKAAEDRAMQNEEAARTMGEYLEKRQALQSMMQSENPDPGALKRISDEMDEALDRFDKESLRRNIREALREMDEMGVSPSVVAEKTLGLKTSPALRGQTPGDTLIKDAHNVVRKKTDGFFTMLWEGFLDTLGSMITTGISVFGGQSGKS
jgi:cell fate (sporulation/competence/biofilm development) regulator YlbF (YheA/YmcA/DUF963 family)